MAYLPKPVEELARLIAKMPGISRRGAEKFLEWWWLREADRKEFGDNWEQFSRLKPCQKCFFFSYSSLCDFCLDKKRDKSKICVASSSFAIVRIAEESSYFGRFFILGGEVVNGKLSKSFLSVRKRVEMLKKTILSDKIEEIILATDFTLKGEATALFVREALKDMPVKISRLAKGFQTGGLIDYGDTTTLKSAFSNRREME